MCKEKGKDRYSSSCGEPHLRATGRHLPSGCTQCYLLPDTSERAPPNTSLHAGTRFTYPGGMEGWVDLRRWLDSAPAGSRTSDLSITSPTPKHCTNKTHSPQKLRNNVWKEQSSALRTLSSSRMCNVLPVSSKIISVTRLLSGGIWIQQLSKLKEQPYKVQHISIVWRRFTSTPWVWSSP